MSDSKIYLDERKKSTYVRKRWWDKDLGKMQQETLHKFESWDIPPSQLPEGIELTENELNQYNEIVKEAIKKRQESSHRVAIMVLKDNLKKAVQATELQDSVAHFSFEELEEIAELAGKLKVQVNKHKNKLKSKKPKA